MARTECPRCHRPDGYCYCKNLQEMQASMDLVVLQHPSESKHALNTARIAALGISNCQILVGEDFTGNTTLQRALKEKSACLLFPAQHAATASSLHNSKEKPELCIVIDGTWRKARKILYSNPFLQMLPAISLEPSHVSEYRIRKAPSEHSLSTVEAIVTFLRQAEGNNNTYQPLLDAFARLINGQINAMGSMIYQKNYSQHPGFTAEPNTQDSD